MIHDCTECCIKYEGIGLVIVESEEDLRTEDTALFQLVLRKDESRVMVRFPYFQLRPVKESFKASLSTYEDLCVCNSVGRSIVLALKDLMSVPPSTSLKLEVYQASSKAGNLARFSEIFAARPSAAKRKSKGHII